MIAAAAGAVAATGASLSPAAFLPDAGAHLLVAGGEAALGGPVDNGHQMGSGRQLGNGGGASGQAGVGGGGPDLGTPRPQWFGATRGDSGQVQRLARGRQIAIERAEAERVAREAADRAAREAAERAAKEAAERAAREVRAREMARPQFVVPAVGRLTSTYGERWGVMHWGIDIANRIGTPVVSVADGVVVEAGPASGFGLWVRVRHGDGTVTVYGHVDRALVRAGQAVRVGEQIATMGNRGDSTGPHLHFEVWTAGGSKVNPLTWLRVRGVPI